MAEQYVVRSHSEESKSGLEKECNRRTLLAVLKELATQDPSFSSDGQQAAFHIEGDDIPSKWRFEEVSGTWCIADVQ